MCVCVDVLSKRHISKVAVKHCNCGGGVLDVNPHQKTHYANVRLTRQSCAHTKVQCVLAWYIFNMVYHVSPLQYEDFWLDEVMRMEGCVFETDKTYVCDEVFEYQQVQPYFVQSTVSESEESQLQYHTDEAGRVVSNDGGKEAQSECGLDRFTVAAGEG